MKNDSGHQQTKQYPTWYWMWSAPARYLIGLILSALAVLLIWGFMQGQWLLTMLLIPPLIALLLIADDLKHQRGNVPQLIRKRMVAGYKSADMNSREALHVLNRVYIKSAELAPAKPRDAWLSKQYFEQAFVALARAETDNPDTYIRLCEYMTRKYYK